MHPAHFYYTYKGGGNGEVAWVKLHREAKLDVTQLHHPHTHKVDVIWGRQPSFNSSFFFPFFTVTKILIPRGPTPKVAFNGSTASCWVGGST